MKPNLFNLLIFPIKKVFLFCLNINFLLNFLHIYLAMSSNKKDFPLPILYIPVDLFFLKVLIALDILFNDEKSL